MTDHASEHDPMTALRLEALRSLGSMGGSTPDDSSLCFSFAVPTLRGAVALAAELRVYAPATVRVRPSLRLALSRRSWLVTMTTVPAPLVPAVVAMWHWAMLDVERDAPPSRLVAARALRAAVRPSSPRA